MTPLFPGRRTHRAPRPTRRPTGLAVATGVALALTLTACGGEDDQASPDAQISAAAEDIIESAGDDKIRQALSEIDAAMEAAQKAGPVRVGACATAIVNGMTLDDVWAVDCARPHGAEVYLSLPLDPLGPAFPGEDAIEAHARPLCAAGLETFLDGSSKRSEVRSNVLEPSEEDWRAGDTSALCYALPVRTDTLTGTLKASG